MADALGPKGCGGTAIKAGLLEEYVTGTVLDALESPHVQEALRDGEDSNAPRLRREREMAILRQRVEFDWRV